MSEKNSPNKDIVAIALQYAINEGGAPKVTAKGKGEVAENIIRVAQENNIAIEENPVLAQALSKVKLESEIPTPLYKAIAEIISFLIKSGKLKK